MPTILGANSASDAYEITNSLRYNYGDGPRLTKSGTSAGSTTFTFSAWVKLSTLDYYTGRNVSSLLSGGSMYEEDEKERIEGLKKLGINPDE